MPERVEHKTANFDRFLQIIYLSFCRFLFLHSILTQLKVSVYPYSVETVGFFGSEGEFLALLRLENDKCRKSEIEYRTWQKYFTLNESLETHV